VRGEPHLARVGVDGADVELAVGPLQDDLLHVDPDLLHPLAPDLEVDELQELLDVAQELLRDALFRIVFSVKCHAGE
jgi:hypothetical protein